MPIPNKQINKQNPIFMKEPIPQEIEKLLEATPHCTIQPIVRKGHPGLETIAKKIENPLTNDNAREIASQLIRTLLNTGTAVGLAATPIDVPYRVIVFRIPEERSDDGIAVPLTVAFNPVIEEIVDQMDIVLGWEGCLSIPGMMGKVPRFNKLRYSYVDLNGQTVRREVSGFHSRLIQHELDHLNGITYVQRMKDMTLFGFTEEIKEYKINLKTDLLDED
jgi:peptide deformylase